MAIELENEKAKTDRLLHEMLPKKVADQLKQGKTVEAGMCAIHRAIILLLLRFGASVLMRSIMCCLIVHRSCRFNYNKQTTLICSDVFERVHYNTSAKQL